MKTRILMIVMAIMLGSAVTMQAQKSKTVYSVCYAYYYETKIFYVSPIVSGQINREGYFDPFPQTLANQWQNRLKKITDMFFAYEKVQMGWGWTDYDKIDNYRTDIIREYKNQGFTIKYVDDFYFRQLPKGE